MKSLILIGTLIIFNIISVYNQSNIYKSKKSLVTFFSKAPLEDIEAKNEKAISLLNVNNNEIVVRIPIKQFMFRNKLMEEHFNENYMESERFPYATFKGKINEKVDFSNPGNLNISATGILNVHGVNKKRTLNGVLTVIDSEIQLKTKFDILLADHKISIPRLVFNKIAEQIEVNTFFSYSTQVKQ
ncbi:MAG: YceI family protein [Flavobacterium sp.]|nr:YceI family protein [Pedobacter sp.]